MARIRLYRDEVEPERLPRACMACVEPAAGPVRKQFAWHPPWVWALLPAGLLPFAIVAMMLSYRRTIWAPLCPQHRSHWFWRAWVVFGGLGGVLLLGILGIAFAASMDRPGARQSEALFAVTCIGGLGLLLVWLIVSIVVQLSAIRPIEITDRTITLTNVSPRFVEEFERKVDERRERREPRDRHPPDGYDDPPRRRPPHPDGGSDQYTR